MDLAHALVLALVQGITEFLPISSSGHLILVPALLGWADQGLGFDIAVHVGTLAAVIAYFRREIVAMAFSVFNPGGVDFELALKLVVASVPLGLAGLAFAGAVESSLRSAAVIAATTAGFGVVLWGADRYGRGRRTEYGLGWRGALAIGCAQALALIPGTSRSGITMTMGLALGLSRAAAGRFSFLLAVPAIAMVAVWQLKQFASSPEPVPWAALGVATAAAAVTAFVTIALFLKLIGRVGMGVFALYRLLLGGVIVLVLL